MGSRDILDARPSGSHRRKSVASVAYSQRTIAFTSDYVVLRRNASVVICARHFLKTLRSMASASFRLPASFGVKWFPLS